MGATGVAGQAQAENAVTGALRQLLAVAESYPDLKANQNFLALQEELESTEGKIAYARQFYNDSAASLNAKIQSFPANLVAGRAGFRTREYFEADERSRDAVRVEL
jgi:LemA protein